MDKNNQKNNENKENNEIINTMYSNNTVSEKPNSTTEHSRKVKLEYDEESEKYIKEMHDLADKNEFKNNVVVSLLGVIIVSVIIFSIIMNTSFMKPKTDVVESKAVINTTDNSSTAKKALTPIDTPTKIFEYLNVEANKKTVLKNAVELNEGSEKGLTVYLLAEILRSNDIAIPTKTSTIKQLVIDLTSMGWKKNTDFTKLEKGDICFTTDMPKRPGVPSHAYIFMGWVSNGKTNYANVIDGQVEEFGYLLHKRNLSITTTNKDKFSFFLRK